ncbi:predicted protein [Verticillium alfalfae VaMs.102]|uniref:Predicted protein n=1 Tax=Verticillium alfalfae (strain VaMs.102 / ATCC MYA-4576 / FGSC 10136) TaxID=526221 RepID=C9SDK6_VERA1|nr:predicted protein [Verticillium alfalfae VaMs.102]EEY16427.1 predicted protein [Verticillium alfalfae VaMs.102]
MTQATNQQQNTLHTADTFQSPLCLPGGGYNLSLIACMDSPWAVLVGTHITRRQHMASYFEAQPNSTSPWIKSTVQKSRFFTTATKNSQQKDLSRLKSTTLPNEEVRQRPCIQRLDAKLEKASHSYSSTKLLISAPQGQETLRPLEPSRRVLPVISPVPVRASPGNEIPGDDGDDEVAQKPSLGVFEIDCQSTDLESDSFDSDCQYILDDQTAINAAIDSQNLRQDMTGSCSGTNATGI